MKKASRQIHRLVATATGTTLMLQPASCLASPGAGFPWDAPLEALQAALIGPVAHSLIAMSLVGAVLSFAIGGDNEIARRLARAGVGVGLALGVLRLMNYLFP